MRPEYRILAASIGGALLFCAAAFVFAQQQGQQAGSPAAPSAAAFNPAFRPGGPGAVRVSPSTPTSTGWYRLPDGSMTEQSIRRVDPKTDPFNPQNMDPLPCGHPLARMTSVGGHRYRTCIYGHEWVD